MLTKDDVLESYRALLKKTYPGQSKWFESRLTRDGHRPGCEAEAIVFCSILVPNHLNPEPLMDTQSGGPDFRCDPAGKQSFVVDVTLWSTPPKRTLQQVPGTAIEVGSLAMPTSKIFRSATGKAAQMANQGCPGVLVICSTDEWDHRYCSAGALEQAIFSDPKITIPLGSTEGSDCYLSSDLEKAPFFGLERASDGAPHLDPKRKTVSAILLVDMSGNAAKVIGALHPDPNYPFDTGNLSQVPFLHVDPWPPKSAALSGCWKIGDLAWTQPERPQPVTFNLVVCRPD